MSDFMASGDTTANVELDTLVDSAGVEDEWVEVSQPIWVWDSLNGCRFSFSVTLA